MTPPTRSRRRTRKCSKSVIPDGNAAAVARRWIGRDEAGGRCGDARTPPAPSQVVLIDDQQPVQSSRRQVPIILSQIELDDAVDCTRSR